MQHSSMKQLREEESRDLLGIYVHIPFCVKKCNYCDFLSAPMTAEYREKYVDALCREIAYTAKYFVSKRTDTIFFGGGTPSILDCSQIGHVMETIRNCYHVEENAEITMECNPGTLDVDKLIHYRNLGINRLSIGLQSVSQDELQLLGRIHTYEQFLENYENARKIGFDNINIDLMSALPDQTVESWCDTVTKVAKLQPDHISAYSLIVEEGTALDLMANQWETTHAHTFPTEEEDRLMYEETKQILQSFGYERYEISNYAKRHKRCRHNLKYWERGSYIGLGLGAASMVDNIRWDNEDDYKRYVDAWLLNNLTIRNIQRLSVNEQMEEFMFLGLRKIQGVSLEQFQHTFGQKMMEVYREVIEKHVSQGLLQWVVRNNEKHITLTEKGLDVSNYVLADFLFD